ncbi:protocadherin-16 [Battus philenor]|uniref:protocadherin-16 n=1 Tax=Battus philenor TaxID=42288 RepID=UPI0035CFC723
MALPLWMAVFATLASSTRAQAVQDSRCYLMNGGAVESFFISEDTPVGSVISTLSVNGDPGALGDIALSLQERDAGLAIAPGSKNLTLARALDREERLGPASLYVNVRCERRRTTDPSFIIPVSVRVWDVNDNAPAWRGAPYSARVSELAAPGTRVLPAPAVDADQPGPHATVHYSVLPGPNSEYIGFANELDSMLVVKKPLDYESVRNFTVRLRAQDQGVPPRYNDTELYIEVLDADDQNPKFTHDHYTAVLPEDAKEGTVLETMPGAISAADQDVGIRAPLQYSLGGAGGAGSAGARPLVTVDRDTGRVVATALLLDVDLPVTVVIKATQVDNPDRYALAALEVSRASARRVRFLRRAFSTRVREDTAPGAMLLALHTAPPQTPLQFYVSDKSFLDKFAINSAGEVLLRKSLDYETTDSYHYQVMVTDGVSNDTASVNITVLNVNEWEPRFRYPHYEFRVDAQAAANTNAVAGEEGDREGGTEGREDVLVGRLDVHDGDRADTVTLTLRGPDAPLLYISETGELFLRRGALAALNASALHVVATAVDSGSPPRQTSVPVTVHVVGAGGGRAARAGVLGGFAAALALLVLLVLALLGYICRARRRSKPGASAVVLPPEKVAGVGNVGGSPALVASGAVAGGGAATGGGSGSLLSVSAGASTIIAGSTASLERTDPQNGRYFISVMRNLVFNTLHDKLICHHQFNHKINQPLLDIGLSNRFPMRPEAAGVQNFSKLPSPFIYRVGGHTLALPGLWSTPEHHQLANPRYAINSYANSYFLPTF